MHRFWQTCLLAALAFGGIHEEARANLVTGNVNFEQLFLDAFSPGTGNGISIASDGTTHGATSDSAFTSVDLDGNGINDIRVDMSYELSRSSMSDSRIGFRSNTAGTQLTLFSDSATTHDFDYGFLEMKWEVSVIGGGSVDFLADMTGSSLNGNTELYEFGIVDTVGSLTAADIAAYDATTYDGTDDLVDASFNNTLGAADDVMLEEFLGTRAGVTYDTDVTAYTNAAGNDIVGGGGNNLGTISGAGISELTLFYGGFDVMNGTAAGSSNVGSPTASLNWSGLVQITQVPEPASSSYLFLLAMSGLTHRRRRG